MNSEWPLFTDHQIVAARGARNAVDIRRPWHFLTEPEFGAHGVVELVATVFLTNRECVYKCLMCDLWKNTTVDTIPPGSIPQQLDYALQRLPAARHIKLYNSGNFFDRRSVTPDDWPAIAQRVSRFATVIVENHPRLTGPECAEFQQLCGTQLEVAMGLETSHAATLALLNKRMTTSDFQRACEMLLRDNIRVRAFILLRPPGVSEEAGVEQAIESVRFAFACGVDCCSVIPTRSGNGILEQLQEQKRFTPPTLQSLEAVLAETLSWRRGRVFADLWDLEGFASCRHCAARRIQRLQTANLTQNMPPAEPCDSCGDCGNHVHRPLSFD